VRIFTMVTHHRRCGHARQYLMVLLLRGLRPYAPDTQEADVLRTAPPPVHSNLPRNHAAGAA
jgi:hypothetical protein